MIKYQEIANISFVIDTILTYRKNRYLSADTIRILSISAIYHVIVDIIWTHLYLRSAKLHEYLLSVIIRYRA